MTTWYFKNKEKEKIRQAKYRAENRHIFVAKDHAYRARKLKAEPKWLTKEMKKQMVNIYKCCRLTSLYHETPHSVDHIIPLKGDNVCGMHVPWNLQIISSQDNMRKKNKEDFTDYSLGFTVIDQSLVDLDNEVRFERKVVRLNDGKVFNSVTLAAESENTTPAMITQVCRKDKASIRRNFYRYYEEVGDVDSEFKKAELEYLSNPKTKKAVYCELNKIRFENTKEASVHFGICEHHVRTLCRANEEKNNRKLKYCI